MRADFKGFNTRFNFSENMKNLLQTEFCDFSAHETFLINYIYTDIPYICYIHMAI